jgi:predicted nicotinamide N-methyase
VTALYGYADPGTQAWMVLDEARTRAYAEAIREVVRPGDVVLDIGAGSGILGLLCAKAGAKRVYAVESSGAVELVREHVRDNGLEEVVQVFHADLRDLSPEDLPEPATVVVSEMLGHFAPDEHQHRLYGAARRLAAPDARWMPSSYRMVFSPARPPGLEAELAALSDVHGVRLPTLMRRLLSRPVQVTLQADDLVGAQVLGPPIAVDAPLPEAFEAAVTVDRDGPVTAIAASFVATLAPGVELCAATSWKLPSHWRHTLFPLDPALDCRAGDRLSVLVRPRLITDRETYAWEVRRGEEVRQGDAMRSLVGGKDDLVSELGLRLKRVPRLVPSPELEAIAAMFGARLDRADDVDSMARRLLDAMPTRFCDLADARQEVLALLRHTGALR